MLSGLELRDVKHLDPILNAILEDWKNSCLAVIRLGSQDIDFSTAFTMFPSTRDPTTDFSPDICSRVTFIDLTRTRRSLQSQSLDQVLKVERLDTERKRTHLQVNFALSPNPWEVLTGPPRVDREYPG